MALKSLISTFFLAFMGQLLFGQNIFPATGKVGIGTSNPQAGLHVNTGLSITGRNAKNGINNFVNSIELINVSNAAILYNPGQDSQQMFGFHSNGSMYWGNTSYLMTLSKAGLLYVSGSLAIGGGLKAGSKMSVNGKLSAKEVEVTVSNWPDYVFKPEYNLMPLKEVEQHIQQYGHLPDIPKTEQIEDEGLSLGEMNKLLMKKIEELTLHLIEKDKEIQDLKLVQGSIVDLQKRLQNLGVQKDAI